MIFSHVYLLCRQTMGYRPLEHWAKWLLKKIKDCNQVLAVECANSRQDCNLYILPADEAAICTYRQQNICCNLYIIPADKAAICTLHRQIYITYKNGHKI